MLQLTKVAYIYFQNQRREFEEDGDTTKLHLYKQEKRKTVSFEEAAELCSLRVVQKRKCGYNLDPNCSFIKLSDKILKQPKFISISMMFWKWFFS